MLDLILEQHFLSSKEPVLRKDFFRTSKRKRADKEVLLVNLFGGVREGEGGAEGMNYAACAPLRFIIIKAYSH